MITEHTIVELVERLEHAVTCPADISKQAWANETKNLIYDVRNDIDKENYGLENFVLREEYDELKKENDELHDEIIELEDLLEDYE